MVPERRPRDLISGGPLFQRRDSCRRLTAAQRLPRGPKLSPMQCGPLVDHVLSTSRKPTAQELRVLEIDQHLVLAVPGMEVRRRVIPGIHRDHDAEESAEFWHC